MQALFHAENEGISEGRGPSLTDGNHYIDNLLAAAWKTLRLNQLLRCAGFSKRHGIEVTETVFVLMVWKWLNVSSVAMFCRHALGMFSRAKKDVLYDFLKREDIDWRKFNMGTAKEVYRQQGLGDSHVKAFVLDDSISRLGAARRWRAFPVIMTM